MRFQEGKGKSFRLLNFFLVLILNILRSNIVYLLVRSYHLLAMFMLVFNSLIYNSFHLEMILRILPLLYPQDKVEVVLLFEPEVQEDRGRGRIDRQCSHCDRTNHTFNKCWDKLVVLYGLIRLSPLSMMELMFLLLLNFQVVAGSLLPYLQMTITNQCNNPQIFPFDPTLVLLLLPWHIWIHILFLLLVNLLPFVSF